jgi:hypothetical protein
VRRKKKEKKGIQVFLFSETEEGFNSLNGFMQSISLSREGTEEGHIQYDSMDTGDGELVVVSLASKTGFNDDAYKRSIVYYIGQSDKLVVFGGVSEVMATDIREAEKELMTLTYEYGQEGYGKLEDCKSKQDFIKKFVGEDCVVDTEVVPEPDSHIKIEQTAEDRIVQIRVEVTNYISWYDDMTEHDGGNRWIRLFDPKVKNKHFYHGSSGRAAAERLLSVLDEKEDNKEIMEVVEDVYQHSGYHKHSLSRYLFDAMHEGDTVGIDAVSDSKFKKLKREFKIPGTRSYGDFGNSG